MNVAIAGLGLIGGSAAKAYHEAGHVVYGLDHDQTVLGFAQLAGVVDVLLDQNNIRECDCLLIALLPIGDQRDPSQNFDPSSNLDDLLIGGPPTGFLFWIYNKLLCTSNNLKCKISLLFPLDVI